MLTIKMSGICWLLKNCCWFHARDSNENFDWQRLMPTNPFPPTCDWYWSEPHLNTMGVSWRNNRFSLLTLHYVFFLIYSSLNKKSIQNTNRYNFKCTKFTLQGTNLALQLDVQQTYGTSVIVNSRLVKCLVVPWTLVVVHAQSAIRHCFWLKPPTWWDLTWHTAQWLIFWITVLIEKGFLRQDSFRSIQDVSNLVSPATKGLS